MHIVLMKFSTNKNAAARFLEGHRSWIKRGFSDGVFLLAGSLEPDQGGAIVAYNTSLADLQSRLEEDPFVAENIVKPEILAVDPGMADERFHFLLK